MKVLQVVADIAHESSGVSYTMSAVCRGLQDAGCDVSLYSTGLPAGAQYPFEAVACTVRTFPSRRLGRSPEMLQRLVEACRTADIVHANGLWMMPNIYPHWATRGTSCKLVMQPHGTLSEYALSISKWKKRLIGWYGQYAALRAADMWVATSGDEYEDIRRLGYRQPVCILPNGVDLPSPEPDLARERSELGKSGLNPTRRRMLFLSRIHPKKNVNILLRVWSRLEIENKFMDWDLSIVGPDRNNAYADEMKVLSTRLGCRRVTFEGELNGAEKYRFMAESDCFVLPTHSENFGMVVAESLACGTPVICSHGAPWEGLVANGCGWWVPTDEAAFEAAMREAMSLDDATRREMGARGREWMRRDFDWSAIGRKMKMSYEWLCGKGDRPEWVVCD